MAVVLSSEENGYFSSSGLRRSYSQPNFVTQHTTFHKSASASSQSELYQSKAFEDSTPSSAPSSPRAIHLGSTDLSCSSTPSSNFSLPPSDCDEPLALGTAQNEGQIILPQYDDATFFNPLEELEAPLSPGTGDSYATSPNEQDTSTNTSRPDSPVPHERAEDDIAVRPQPSRHVDYLSHNWKEEDIWSSWKLIVSRRGDYSNSARLENASWRTWMKSKNNLRTVSPETLNWLKDCDVTWLYGPLQTRSATPGARRSESKMPRLPSPTSFSKKKPILKKRSMSELMLQRSLSTSSLVKQAAAAVQAQQSEDGVRSGRRPGLGRAITDSMAVPFSARRNVDQDNNNNNNPDLLMPSSASSSIASPSNERKHIHFNEQVAQCIAVEVKGEDDDDDVETNRFTYDSDSDDGAIMMKRTIPKKRRPILKRTKSNNSNGESKTIAMLPSTTLKYREDTPEPDDSAMKHSTSIVYRSPVISPSSSQETLRPSKPSGRLRIGPDDDDDDDDDEDEDDEEDTEGVQGGGSSRGWRSPTKFGEGSSGLHRSLSSGSLSSADPAGMRRTPSGMLMPYEEGEPASTQRGMFARVIDTVNTARDITYVIWNVGWRS